MNKYLLLPVLLALFACHTPSLPRVEIQCSMGNILIEVDTIRAPVTGTNFMTHVDAETYAGASFYRVVCLGNQPQNKVKIEVIQGGLRDDARIEKFPAIAHESTEQTGLKHLNGIISMARNEPGSASTEFFICVGDQPELDFGGQRNPDGQGFAAFGKVLEGMDVVRQIQLQPEHEQSLDRPVQIYRMVRAR